MNLKKINLNHLSIHTIVEKYPQTQDFFESFHVDIQSYGKHSLQQFLDANSLHQLEEWGINKSTFLEELENYIAFIEGMSETNQIDSITILPGHNKDGEKEEFDQILINKSDIVSIVGATGSGKSRLLADIEWLANQDTPTGRKILINGQTPDYSQRYNPQNKMVAQLSQNMNFVMDLTVKEFLDMHAESRMVSNPKELVEKIEHYANDLAGEKFNKETNITALSGGQSRALMIADTAILSQSSIVLIDEIENAGIDRHKALSLLVNEEKIVLIATHDPSLALMADRRLIIKNGGISHIIQTSQEEKAILKKLDEYDSIIQGYREKLRYGEKLI